MPIEFDPEWEYWEPTPEVAEVLIESRRTDGTLGGVFGDDDVTGFRFGRGAGSLRALPYRERGGAVEKRVAAPRVAHVCAHCGRRFEPKNQARPNQRCCSVRCANTVKRDAHWVKRLTSGRAQQIARATELRQSGVQSLAEIAAAVGANLHTVNRWLRKAGLTHPRTRKPKCHS